MIDVSYNDKLLFENTRCTCKKFTLKLNQHLFQAGPLDKVSIAKEKETGKQKSFAFVTFVHDVSVPYTIKLMDGTQLFGRNLRLQTRPGILI